MLDLTLQDFNGEPRMRDIDIAEALGFERPRNIRKLVNRYIDSLEAFGEVFRSTVERNSGAGRPEDCFWLNEQQTVFICLKSEAPKAVELTVLVVQVFIDWKNGRLTPPAAPQRIPNCLHPEADTWRGIVREARILFGKEVAAVLWHQSSLPEIDLPDKLQQMPERFDIERFLVEACDITGDHRDFTTSRDLIDALIDWFYDQDAPPMGPRSAALRLKALAGTWRHPQTGRTFGPVKRRASGYRGIRLKVVDA